MKIRSLEVGNFRRFRQPIRLDGFSGGLNVVVEPNETGKSTLLEALRAALFVRHSAKTELTRSYCPIGDEVGPRVAVDFEVRGERWQVEKRFLRLPKVELTGPRGRSESDAAEEQLQVLLGFERGNNRGTDPDTRGALGLLWVEQASALRVDAPNRLVRDNVRSALESEVGAITGGRRFDAVRSRVEDAYGKLKTGRQGRSTGKLLAAETKLATARERREGLEVLARAHDASLTELEGARGTLRRVEQELGDPEQVRLRDSLATDLKLAEQAADRLATAKARAELANATVERLADRVAVITIAETAVTDTEAAHAQAAKAVEDHATELNAAVAGEDQRGRELAAAREARTLADEAVRTAREVVARRDRADALRRARERLASLDVLEAELVERQRVAGQAIEFKELSKLAALDKAVVEARAVVSAGAVRVEIASLDGTPVSIDGELAGEGGREITAAVVIAVGAHATVRIIPPGTGSATAQLKAAESALAAALARHGVTTYADAVARADAARSAGEGVKALQRQIATLCVADAVLGLAVGPEALRALIGTVPPDDAGEEVAPDLAATERSLATCSEAERAAAGRHTAALAALRGVEDTARTLGLALAGAERDLANAEAQLAALIAPKSKPELEAELADARRLLAERLGEQASAEQATGAFDIGRLKLRISNIDRSTASATDQRMALIERIAGLAATVENEGAKGLAGQVAAAREEEAAAEQAVARLTHEAEVLELLRTTLREAQEAASAKFLGPVTRRAVDYVRRVLPGCDITFSDELGLSSVVRGGISEGCGDLSRGTQEQLAVLTRLAFADLLLDKGEPVSLILDDPLVYSDDARLEVMTDILAQASERMQVILLTCRERAFRHLGGNRVII